MEHKAKGLGPAWTMQLYGKDQAFALPERRVDRNEEHNFYIIITPFQNQQGITMDDMDFERRRELRRQKREEMRLEAERMARNDDEEEEVAREKRRRARQERLKSRESEDSSGQPDGLHVTNSHSVTETEAVSSSFGGGGGGGGGDEEEEQALMERMAKREERRQRRMKEALERQRELDPTVAVATETNNNTEEEERRPGSWRGGRHRHDDEEEAETYGGTREQEEEEQQQEEAPLPADQEEEQEQVGEEEAGQKGVEPEEEEPPRRSYMREQEHAEDRTPRVGDDNNSNQGEESARSEAEEDAILASEEVEADEHVDSVSHDTARTPSGDAQEDHEVSENGLDVVNERGGAREERERKQNGGLYEETPPPKQHRQPERTFSRGSFRSPDPTGAAEDPDDGAARLEAERKLEELRRRRDDAESEEFERMRQRQQEAEVELDELKRRREERRKVLEEEEGQRKQEEAERKAREEDEKRKMKEEIEKRRAEAAEKRQKVEEDGDGEGQPFKCVSPRGSSLKIGERAEFLNKSAQKSALKASHSPVVSKIDNRLEQYTSAAQRENRESRSPRSGAVDLPMVTDGVRSIKSMWEKGSVFSSPGGGAAAGYKEAAVMKIGVAGRINDWLNKTPEGGKTLAGGRPTDLKPVDVTNKRSLWENKGASPAKATGRGEAKSVTNGMGH